MIAWRRGAPLVPGFYWYRDPASEGPIVLEVIEVEGWGNGEWMNRPHRRVCWMGDELSSRLAEEDYPGDWAPILPPVIIGPATLRDLDFPSRRG